jgi:8-oxo-dGTP pyrophosphatase MutT (NUDIX family)
LAPSVARSRAAPAARSAGQQLVRSLVPVGLAAFRYLPRPVRLLLVRLGTPSYTVGAIVLVRRGAEVLLVRQRHTGAWALPGGLLSRGEGADDALARELDEELGLTVGAELGPPVGVLVDPRPRRVDVLYALDLADGTDAPAGTSPEVLETGWFDPAAPPQLTPVTPAIMAEYARVGALPARG